MTVFENPEAKLVLLRKLGAIQQIFTFIAT